MDKLEQVFISSTYLDLMDARQAVIKVLLEADCFPSGMELFPASDDDRWTLIKRVIDNSDYYLVIVGGRYGSVDEDTKLSYTEMEFDYAVDRGKPIMGFVHGAPDELPAKHTERDAEAAKKLEAFKTKVQQRMCKMWTTPDGLAGSVAISLNQTRKTHPAVGWVRGDQAMTPETRTEMAELRERVVQLERELSGTVTAAGDPSGLEQGQDPFEVELSIRFFERGRGSRGVSRGILTTWDALFSYVAPTLMDEGAEGEIQAALKSHLIDLYVQEHDDIPSGATNVTTSIDKSSVADVVVQLYALGLIQRGTKKRTASDTNTYWKLTKQGEDYLMKLRARRRPVKDATS